MTDAASLAFWRRVEQEAYWHWQEALYLLGVMLGSDRELELWGVVIRKHRAWVWADTHRCMAERPRSAFWYVKAGA